MNDWSALAKVYNPLKAGSIDSTDVEPHDRAIWRAMNTNYNTNKGVIGDPHLSLFVARLNKKTSEEEIHKVFSEFGDIRRLRLVRDNVTGISKGYAFVEYKEERSLMKAWRDANKMVLDQQELFVDFEHERTLQGWIPRRLGGGLGGKKESGQLRFGGRDRPFRRPINLPNMIHRPLEQSRLRDEVKNEKPRARDSSPGQDSGHGWQRDQRGKWVTRNEQGGRSSERNGKDPRWHRKKSREKDYSCGKKERGHWDSYIDFKKR